MMIKNLFLYRIFFILFLNAAFDVSAQQKLVLEVQPLSIRGASNEEAHAIENLMFSYLSEKNLILVRPIEAKPKTKDNAKPEVIAPPDFIMNTSLSYNDSSYTFEIGIRKQDEPKPIYTHVSSHRSSSEIALTLRSIVDEALKENYAGKTIESIPLQLSRDKILGLWKGDNGVELIRFLPDGKGFAFFSSGVNMMFNYSIDNNVLYVVQISPNNELFHYPFPMPVAKRLAASADPMRWELSLVEGGQALKGKRISTTAEFVNYDNITIIKNNESVSRWNKMPR